MCPELTPPKNGRIFQDLNQGRKCNDVAFFECNHGYTRDGPLASTCLPSGQWSHPTPVCQCNNKMRIGKIMFFLLQPFYVPLHQNLALIQKCVLSHILVNQ